MTVSVIAWVVKVIPDYPCITDDLWGHSAGAPVYATRSGLGWTLTIGRLNLLTETEATAAMKFARGCLPRAEPWRAELCRVELTGELILAESG